MQRCRLFCQNQGIYLYKCIQVTKHTLSWWRFLSCRRNQSTDLLYKSMDWSLYDQDFRHKRDKTLFTYHTPKVCSYMLQSRIHFFFPIWVFFNEYSRLVRQQGKGKDLSLCPFYHFPSLHRHLVISRVIAAGSSPRRVAASCTRTRNLWFPNASR